LGQQKSCSVRFGDKVSEGKALLEADELIFRGEIRLTIPFKQMRSVEARDGELRVAFEEGEAVFVLGAQAATWAQKILHPKSLLDKLGVKPGMNVAVVGVEDDTFLEDLRARTKHVTVGSARSGSDMVFVAVEGPKDLGALTGLKTAIKPDGAAWVVFRKGRKDFNENDVLRGGLAAGLVDVKVVRFSDTHTACKFVIRRSER
jgi:hypothetical protein